jgi:hypothetical protein
VEILIWVMLWTMLSLALFIPAVVIVSGILVFVSSVVEFVKSKF